METRFFSCNIPFLNLWNCQKLPTENDYCAQMHFDQVLTTSRGLLWNEIKTRFSVLYINVNIEI